MLQPKPPETPYYSAAFLVGQILDEARGLSTREICGLVLSRTTRQQRADWFPELLPAFVHSMYNGNERRPRSPLRTVPAASPAASPVSLPGSQGAPSSPQPHPNLPATPTGTPGAAEVPAPPPQALYGSTPRVDTPAGEAPELAPLVVVAVPDGTADGPPDPHPPATRPPAPRVVALGGAVGDAPDPTTRANTMREDLKTWQKYQDWWTRKQLRSYRVHDKTRKVIGTFTSGDFYAVEGHLRAQGDANYRVADAMKRLGDAVAAAGVEMAADLQADVAWQAWHGPATPAAVGGVR